MNQKLFDECFDDTKDEYYQILKLIEENKDYSKIQCEGVEIYIQRIYIINFFQKVLIYLIELFYSSFITKCWRK